MKSRSHEVIATKRLPKQLFPRFEPVIVTWEDAERSMEEATIDEASAPTPCIRRSIGFVVRCDTQYVILAQTDDRETTAAHLAHQPMVSDLMTIPYAYVRAIEPLRKK